VSKPAKITVYGNTTCPYCGAARMLLARKAVEFEDIVITGDPRKRQEMQERSGRTAVPQIFIGDRPIGGFDELSALDRSGDLDKMLAG